MLEPRNGGLEGRRPRNVGIGQFAWIRQMVAARWRLSRNVVNRPNPAERLVTAPSSLLSPPPSIEAGMSPPCRCLGRHWLEGRAKT